MAISFRTADQFAEDIASWPAVGAIGAVDADGGTFRLGLAEAPLAVRLSFCAPTCLRVRFGPRSDENGADEASHAVIDRNLAPIEARIVENSGERLRLDTGAMRIEVDRRAFALRIFRGEQLISADQPGRALLYRPEGHGIAAAKVRPENALYCGFGEKTGPTLLMNGARLTNFNFDNFSYARAPIPPGSEGGPLNPAEPLYASIPLLIEVNRAPTGPHAGPPYCYGLFFDNVSQSYFDLTGGPSSEGSAQYTFGALFGALDYYLILGEDVPDILRQFTRLTGRSGMPPLYAFGFHQGCYGYFDRARLEAVARAYRQARIPIDGLHIDIDLQDNYRVFTHSEAKFPNAAEMIARLHADGFKCSTVVTPLVTRNPLDERGEIAPFIQRRELLEAGCLLYDVRAGQPPRDELFTAAVSYGANRGVNPYAYPPLTPNRDGVTPLGGEMNYPDLGRADVREVWSRQYAHLVDDLGIDMIWQDMMCPAAAVAADTPDGTLPLDLMTHDGRDYVPHGVCHNAYAQFMLQATHAALRALKPETRPFILARGGYAGLQRYAALWSGDNASSWDFLRTSIPQALNLGLSGVPLSGSDIGGFATGPVAGGTTSASVVRDRRVSGGVTDPELFVRWMQAGSFLPWFRSHYIGYDKEYQEAYAFPEPVPAICRRTVERRYRLLPLFYDAMYAWTETGMPIARALFLNDPEDARVYQCLDDQFFLGKDLLVAPVVAPAPAGGGAARRDVYLPAGSDWFPFVDGAAPLAAAIEGGRLLQDVEVALDHLPLFVRAGAILPLRARIEQYVGELAENPLDMHLYPGPDDAHLLYQDDGISMRAETRRAFRTTRISRRAVPGGVNIRLQRVHDGYKPPERFLFIRLLGSPPPASVTVAGAKLDAVSVADALDAAPMDAYLWAAGLRTTVVKVFDRAPDITVTVTFRR